MGPQLFARRRAGAAALRQSKNSEWYKGTANAIYQNIGFIQRYNPDNVLILSGDHIYKMDYAAMLKFHESMESDCTIAVRDVPLKEASRFGIMNTREDGSIYEFEEKPKHPKSTNASMGIYVFKWSVLKEFLRRMKLTPRAKTTSARTSSRRCFIPGTGCLLYQFDGYWKDVGTISSLWEANMDLLGKHPAFDIYGPEGHKIYARNATKPASYIAKSAELHESFVADGCEIFGMIDHSVISTGCTVGKGAEVIDSVIMPDVVIEKRRIHPQRDHCRGLRYSRGGEDRRRHRKRRAAHQRHRQGEGNFRGHGH